MTNSKNHISRIFLIPIIAIIGIISSCENSLEEVEALTKKSKLPIRTASNVEFIYSESATVKIKVKAPKMEEYGGEKNYMEMTEGIEVLFYDSVQKVSTTLTANYAINRIAENVMEAQNDVVVVNEKGEKLNTEKLFWVQDSAKIYSDDFVKITTADEVITGEGLEATEDFSKYKIKKIKGIINIKDKDLENE